MVTIFVRASRTWVIIALLIGTGCKSQPSLAPNEAEAIATIQKLGGRVSLTVVDGLSTAVSVDLRHSQIRDVELEPLVNLPNVKTLRLARTQIGDDGLQHVGKMSNLEELYLGRTKVTDRGLNHLTGLANLRWIAVSHTEITDRGIRQLQKSLPALKRVR